MDHKGGSSVTIRQQPGRFARSNIKGFENAMPEPTDVRAVASTLYFLPVTTRMPLKFGSEVTTRITCARVALTVRDARGRTAEGWGETPLSVHWVWPSTLPYEQRLDALKRLCLRLSEAWSQWDFRGHPIEIGHAFQEQVLPGLLDAINSESTPGAEPMPWLAALVACSAFDLALHATSTLGAFHGLTNSISTVACGTIVC